MFDFDLILSQEQTKKRTAHLQLDWKDQELEQILTVI